MRTDSLAFVQFRRLLLGVVVEILQGSRVDADVTGMTAEFEPESGFRFRWVDNWMRFRGWVRIPLRTPVENSVQEALKARFQAVWPEITGALATLPMADRLGIVRNEVNLLAEEDQLTVRFDLEAD